jgi:hypothetical protein
MKDSYIAIRYLNSQIWVEISWVGQCEEQPSPSHITTQHSGVTEPPRGGVPRPGSAWVILGEARTQSTHTSIQYHIISSSRSYYNLGSCISYTKEVWSQNHTLGDKSEFAKAISLNVQSILFALEENAIHQLSKPENPSTVPNPHRFGPPNDNPRWYHRKQGRSSSPAHRIQQEQRLSDYAQQDLSTMIKRPPLDMWWL